MIKHLQKYGNNNALIIDRALLEVAQISPYETLHVADKEGALVVTSTNPGLGKARIEELMAKLRVDYGDAFRRLAEGPP